MQPSPEDHKRDGGYEVMPTLAVRSVPVQPTSHPTEHQITYKINVRTTS